MTNVRSKQDSDEIHYRQPYSMSFLDLFDSPHHVRNNMDYKNVYNGLYDRKGIGKDDSNKRSAGYRLLKKSKTSQNDIDYFDTEPSITNTNALSTQKFDKIHNVQGTSMSFLDLFDYPQHVKLNRDDKELYNDIYDQKVMVKNHSKKTSVRNRISQDSKSSKSNIDYLDTQTSPSKKYKSKEWVSLKTRNSCFWSNPQK